MFNNLMNINKQDNLYNKIMPKEKKPLKEVNRKSDVTLKKKIEDSETSSDNYSDLSEDISSASEVDTKKAIGTETEGLEEEDVEKEDVEKEESEQDGGEEDDAGIGEDEAYGEEDDDTDDDESEEEKDAEDIVDDAGQGEGDGEGAEDFASTGEDDDGTCAKSGSKKGKKKYDINDTLDIVEDVDVSKDTEERIPDEDRIIYPKPRLTKYELVKIIGTRATQISGGSKIFISNYRGLTPQEIAKEELKNAVSGLMIKRLLPNKKYEIWKLNELELEQTIKLVME